MKFRKDLETHEITLQGQVQVRFTPGGKTVARIWAEEFPGVAIFYWGGTFERDEVIAEGLIPLESGSRIEITGGMKTVQGYSGDYDEFTVKHWRRV